MAKWKRQLSKRRRKLALTQLFSKEEHATFVQAFAAYVEPRGIEVTVKDDVATLRGEDGDEVALEISQLAERCQRSAPMLWPALVADHLDRTLHPVQTPTAFDPLDFEQAQNQLRVRLCAPEAVDAPGAEAVVRQDPADGLVAVLTFDLGAESRKVRPEEAEAWATPQAAVFAVAYQNLRAVELPTSTARELPSGASLIACRSDSPFLTAQLLVSDRFLGSSDRDRYAELGILASVPKADLILLHPIGQAGVVTVVQEMARITRLLHEKGPAPLSPHVYWWRKKALTRLPVSHDAEGAHFSPPPRFQAHVIEPLDG